MEWDRSSFCFGKGGRRVGCENVQERLKWVMKNDFVVLP